MAINRLPDSTIRLLGSSQVLTSPLSLIKELIDNALDAEATTIEVYISPNTLDKIEVRDNGHGISKDDLDALGRRGYTSKLRDFAEVAWIGGTSLGFRGEALFSATQLGCVTVTSKTDGASVATRVKLRGSGGVESECATSHPRGTTILVTNFMASLPVRKQTILKEPQKAISKIRDLIQAYAVARRTIRFNLKVLKTGKGSWSYAPRADWGIKEVISTVFGREAAAQGMEKSMDFDLPSDGNMHVVGRDSPRHQATVHGYVARSDVECSSLQVAKYISIDSRPISADRGIGRRLVKLYKKHYSSKSISSTNKTPFLYLNIACPVGAYDPNVEPAKDDVLFGHEDSLQAAVEAFFSQCFGQIDHDRTAASPVRLDVPGTESPPSFNMMLSRRGQEHQTPPLAVTIESEANDISAEVETQSIGSPDHHTHLTRQDSHGESSSESLRLEVVDAAPLRIDMSAIDDDLDVNGQLRSRQGPTGINRPAKRSQDTPLDMASNINPWTRANRTATSVKSAQAFRMPTMLGAGTVHGNASEEPDQSTVFRSHFGIEATPIDRENRVQQAQISPHHDDHEGRPYDQRHSLFIPDDEDRPRNSFVSARQVAELGMLSPPATQLPKIPRSHNRRHVPFVSPARFLETRSPTTDLHQTRLILEPRRADSADVVRNDSSADVAWALDYEHRKELLTRARRAETRARREDVEDVEDAEDVEGTTAPPRSSPHKNRYAAALTDLHAGLGSGEHTRPRRGEADARDGADTTGATNSLDFEASVQGKRPSDHKTLKCKRIGEAALPLETIPSKDRLQRLECRLVVQVGDIRAQMQSLATLDTYGGLSLPTGTPGSCRLEVLSETDIQTRLRRVVSDWQTTTTTPGSA